MPVKGKLPKWERESNRLRIYLTLLGNPMSFSALQRKTGFSRSTLSGHLKNLLDSGVVEKAIRNGKVVYETIEDRQKLKSEIMKLQLQSFLEFVAKTSPDTFEKIEKLVDEWIMKMDIGSLALKRGVEYTLKKLK